MGLYDIKPDQFLECRDSQPLSIPPTEIYCAGFELQTWRCSPFADHLIEWLPEYALPEDEMQIHHGNAFVKLKQAAVRVYTSDKYANRGEVGEIALHAVCRQFFDTIPISPRVFYKSATNDVIKSFDLVHARFPVGKPFEIWLGESKLYKDASSAIGAAISSISSHIEMGFLKNQKLLLGPQIPKNSPHYDEILKVFKTQSSIDDFLKAAVFIIGIACDSKGAAAAKECDVQYVNAVKKELEYLAERISNSGLCAKLRIMLVYIPLASKDDLVTDFDAILKGLQ